MEIRNIVEVENITYGHRLIEDERVKIVEECTFTVKSEKYKFAVECYALDEDEHDTYSVRIYDNTNSEIRDDETQVGHAYLDSTGGSCVDEEITVAPLGSLTRMSELEELIGETLFSSQNGIIIPF